MAALLERDELDEAVLGIADELADQFVADLDGVVVVVATTKDDIRQAVAGLQLTFLSRVAKLVASE
jgi:hypothetical protein